MKRINIILGANGIGTIECVGLGTFECGGNATITYPRDITINPSDKKGTHRSREFNVDMPYAILMWGQRGIYIHEWGRLGGSMGCIQVLPGAAKQVYDFVSEPTRILISQP